MRKKQVLVRKIAAIKCRRARRRVEFELIKTGQKIENRLAIIDVSRQNAIENRLMRGRIESDGQTDLVLELSLLAFPNSSFL